jgi:hypothetical protein
MKSLARKFENKYDVCWQAKMEMIAYPEIL